MKFKYSDQYSPPAPVLHVGIETLNGIRHDLELVIDTGFSGGVLLPMETYLELGLSKWEVEDVYYGILPTGRNISLYTAISYIIVGKYRFLIHVHTSPLINKSLAGRELLNRLRLILDGPNKTVYID